MRNIAFSSSPVRQKDLADDEIRHSFRVMVGEHCGATVNKIRPALGKAVINRGTATTKRSVPMPLTSLSDRKRAQRDFVRSFRSGTITPVKHG
jgi:hypothetical protein